MDLKDLVLHTIKKYGMFSKGDKVVVGVSGGPDSTALLLVLSDISDEFDLSVYAAHLNHMIRGEEADEDEKFVKELCERIGIELRCGKRNVPELRRSLKISEEDAGRRARYEFLKSVAEELGANKIAVGHTADDQVETVLMRIIRGCGIEGLKGIPPVRGMIVRPLIDASGSEIHEYLKGRGVVPRIDSSNLISKYLRNKVRNELLPLLSSYNPGIRGSLIRLAELAREEDEYMRSISLRILDEISEGEDEIRIDRSSLGSIPIPLRRRAVREAIRRAKGDLKGMNYDHVRLVLDPPYIPFALDLPGGIRAEISEKTVKITGRKGFKASPLPVYLSPPGCFELSEWGFFIKMYLIDRDKISEEEMKDAGRWKAFMDFDKLSLPLLLRARERGDRIRPFGMKGTKKVKEIMIEEKIPREERDKWPIICSGDKVAWIVGLRSSEDFRVTDRTRKVLIIEALSRDGGGFSRTSYSS